MNANNPLYVEEITHGMQVPVIPAICSDCTLMGFFVRTDRDALQATVDKLLSAPTQGAVEYYVIGSHVVLSYSNSAGIVSAEQQAGCLPVKECAFWVPLFARSQDGSQPDRIVFWTPYLFIDSSPGMATGREIWGFRKEYGDNTIPQDPNADATFSTIAQIYDPLANTSMPQNETVISVKKTGKLGALEGATKDLTGMGKKIVEFWTDGAASLPVSRLSFSVDIAETLISKKVPFVNLKQFRDAADCTRACYQALIEATLTPTAFHGGGLLLGDYNVNVADFPSHMIASDLGITPNTSVPVEFAFWMNIDFTADSGTEVWKA